MMGACSLRARGQLIQKKCLITHYNDVIMSTMASQITVLTIVCSTRLFRRRWRKTSELRVTGLCEGNSPVTGEFPTQRASNAENIFIWWRHHHAWSIFWWVCSGGIEIRVVCRNRPFANCKKSCFGAYLTITSYCVVRFSLLLYQNDCIAAGFQLILHMLSL